MRKLRYFPLMNFRLLVISRKTIMLHHLIIEFLFNYSSTVFLREIINKRKFQTFSSKSGRRRLREVVAYKKEVSNIVIWLGNFWQFEKTGRWGEEIAYKRWSQREVWLYLVIINPVPRVSHLTAKGERGETLIRSGHVCLKIWDVTNKRLVGGADKWEICLYLAQRRAVSVWSQCCVYFSKRFFALRGQMWQRSSASGGFHVQTPKKTYKACARASPSCCRLCKSTGEIHFKNLFAKGNRALLSAAEENYDQSLKCLYGLQGFYSYGSSLMWKKVF